MNGVGIPAFDECPGCGEETFSGIEIARQGVTIILDGGGGVATVNTDELIEAKYSYLQCVECGLVLIEDGEIVHEAIE